MHFVLVRKAALRIQRRRDGVHFASVHNCKMDWISLAYKPALERNPYSNPWILSYFFVKDAPKQSMLYQYRQQLIQISLEYKALNDQITASSEQIQRAETAFESLQSDMRKHIKEIVRGKTYTPESIKNNHVIKKSTIELTQLRNQINNITANAQQLYATLQQLHKVGDHVAFLEQNVGVLQNANRVISETSRLIGPTNRALRDMRTWSEKAATSMDVFDVQMHEFKLAQEDGMYTSMASTGDRMNDRANIENESMMESLIASMIEEAERGVSHSQVLPDPFLGKPQKAVGISLQ